MNQDADKSQQKASLFYIILILVGLIGNVANFLSNWQTVISTLGVFISSISVGIGIIGIFVSQKRIKLKDGILYSLIWTILIFMTGVGYYILLIRPVTVAGTLFSAGNSPTPLNAVEVTLYQLPTGNSRNVTTNTNGEFIFHEVNDGQFNIRLGNTVIFSGEVSGGIRKLFVGDVNVGSLYNLSITPVITPTPQYTASIPTETETSTLIIPTLEPSVTFTPISSNNLTHAPSEHISPSLIAPTITEALGVLPIELESECRVHAMRNTPATIYASPDRDSARLAVVGNTALVVKGVFNTPTDQLWVLEVNNLSRDGYVFMQDVNVSVGCSVFMRPPPIAPLSPFLTITRSGQSVILRNLPSFSATAIDQVYRDDQFHVLVQCGEWYQINREWSTYKAWVFNDYIELNTDNLDIPIQCP